MLQHIETIYLSSLLNLLCCFFVFYPVRRIFVWSNPIEIYFMTFLIHKWAYSNLLTNSKEKLTFHWFQIILISIFDWFKRLFYNFICSINNHYFYVIIFWMHYTLFIIIYRKKNFFFDIFNSIFYMSFFLRLFMMSIKYGLTLLRHSSTDSFFFYHHYFHIQCNFYSKNYLLLLVYNNFLLCAQKDS